MRGDQKPRQEDKAKTKQDKDNDEDKDLSKIGGESVSCLGVGKCVLSFACLVV